MQDFNDQLQEEGPDAVRASSTEPPPTRRNRRCLWFAICLQRRRFPSPR